LFIAGSIHKIEHLLLAIEELHLPFFYLRQEDFFFGPEGPVEDGAGLEIL
jgi:hypothetical protein